jgi:hypothetical protein
LTPATLQALRRLLFFSVDEAASMIGGVSPRSWQYWERGNRTIPEDVIKSIRGLCTWRAQALATAEKQIAELQARHGPAAQVALLWYQSLDDWATLPGREPVQWRPQCSVVAELAARHNARLVTFDGPAYAAWLGRRKDSEAMRGAWAAEL